jgi:hypothetical protein
VGATPQASRVIFRSQTLPRFWDCYGELPDYVQRRADRQFEMFLQNPLHPSLHLKPVGGFWAVRITDAYRALAVREGNTFTWVWIGSHDEYERIIR